ncbi:unnamed protein product [Parnassius apollo]|uniref:(apollo) hypothetical protein n=1 Tax=Parnassius apollo TaxID=110799 RepID=A0A8S3XRA3_PARAO|nr:unnamed protein product [Parnassius apollo]
MYIHLPVEILQRSESPWIPSRCLLPREQSGFAFTYRSTITLRERKGARLAHKCTQSRVAALQYSAGVASRKRVGGRGSQLELKAARSGGRFMLRARTRRSGRCSLRRSPRPSVSARLRSWTWRRSSSRRCTLYATAEDFLRL